MNGHIVKLFDYLLGHHSSFFSPSAVTKSQGNHLSWRVNNTERENFAVITFFLGNGTKQAYSYYGSLTGSRRWPIDPCWFQ